MDLGWSVDQLKQYFPEGFFPPDFKDYNRAAFKSFARLQDFMTGAPVNVERDAACSHCRTPLAIVDPDQVRKTMAELQAAAEEKTGVDPALPVSLAMERLRAERAFADAPGSSRRPAAVDLLFGDLSDPVAGFLRLLGRLRSS